MPGEDFTNKQDTTGALERFAKPDDDARGLPAVIPQQAYMTMTGQRIVGAQNIAVLRDERKVLAKLKELAGMAGGDWFYRFPVKDNKAGGKKYIEGPSKKLTNDLVRLYGNCSVDCTLVIDIGDYWMIHAEFVDYETGFRMSRPWQQPKAGSRLGGDDEDRRQGISLQIGISKAERNVIANALQTLADFAFQQARSSIVDEIGRDLAGWREKASAKLGANLLPRAEAIVGKPLKDWLAPDIARVRAMVLAVDDGMASIDDTFPPLPAAEEKPRSGVAEFGRTEADPAQASAATADTAAAQPQPEEGDQDDFVFGKPPPEEAAAAQVVDFKGEKVLAAAITACKSLKDLRGVWDANVQPFEEKMGAEVYGRLSKVANDRKTALKRAGQAAAKK